MQSIRPACNTFIRSSTHSYSPFLSCRAAYLATPRQQQQQQQRTFISNPFTSGPQTLSASRTLSYPTKVIYSIISDVGSYSTFLPYCQESVVTKHSSPASDGKEYPEEAKLVVGFGSDISETFWSRVYCVPETVVEAVAGQAETSLGSKSIEHHTARSEGNADPTRNGAVLSHLMTRWTLRSYPYKKGAQSVTGIENSHNNQRETNPAPSVEMTDVDLHIEYQFANPVYGALSSAAAPKVADKMMDAFMKKVEAVAGKQTSTQA